MPNMRALFYRGLYRSFDFCAKLVLRRQSPLEIQGGLFKGMRWGTAATCGSLTPKLMGTYERELQSWLESLPGIDGSLAEKIVSNRPYQMREDLFGKTLLSRETYEQIKDLIIAR